MPETCLRCGRTYVDAWQYDEHACIETAIPNGGTCHEEVTRRGIIEPCDLMAVAMRIDPEDATGCYPVCKRHTRGPMVPLATIDEDVRGDVRA